MQTIKEKFTKLKSKRKSKTRHKTMTLSFECIRKTLIAVSFFQSNTQEPLSFGLVTESVLNDLYATLENMPERKFEFWLRKHNFDEYEKLYGG